MRDRSVVTVQTEKRYYIYGKGYRSNLVAHQQIAKRYVQNLARAYTWRIALRGMVFNSCEYHRSQTLKFMQNRYPATSDCWCGYCKGAMMPNRTWWSKQPGCWPKRMRDYRKIAREIIAGTRDMQGNPIEEIKALPAPRKSA